MGRVMYQRPVAHQGAILELDTRSWSNGTYIIGLTVDGIKAGSAKLQRTR